MEPIETFEDVINTLRDPKDKKYMLSFDNSELELAKTFFEKNGFVVIRDVFNKSECAETREAMWNIIENNSGKDGFRRDDPQTWHKYRASGKYVRPPKRWHV